MSDPERTSRSDIGASDPDAISVLGHDLASDTLGQVGFGELACGC